MRYKTQSTELRYTQINLYIIQTPEYIGWASKVACFQPEFIPLNQLKYPTADAVKVCQESEKN